MRVAFDISVLGRGVLNPRNRTGIHRVASDLIGVLASIPGVELVLCAASPSALLASMEAVATLDPPVGASFAASPAGLSVGGILGRWAKFADRFASLPKCHSLARKVTSLGERLAWKAAPPIPRRLLSTIDVYLSPFDPLPDKSLMPQAKRAVVIHDLIPILFPGLSGEGGFLHRIRASVREGDLILTVSDASRQDLIHMGASPDQVVAVPLFADPKVFRPASSVDVSPAERFAKGKPYLLALGNLEPRKNLGAALQAFEDVCSQDPYKDIQLVLAGTRAPGHTEKLPESTKDRVHFAGRVPDQELGALYRGATAFLFPSTYEGFGLPVLEAMQCGTPVIVSNRSSMPEVAGSAGIMIPPDSPPAFADALRQILSNPELRRDLSEAGIAQAAKFSRQRFHRDIVAALGLPTTL
ncbi:MAG: glycosyltransferase family 4 protein [Fibrobacteria bacterium]|nr:glycosyltransferase family 4 protein [Fibrobacteria bacterium]